MLANGATLGYRTASTGDYTNLPGLKEIPEMGVDPERVENTALTDANKQYELGIGDLPDLQYTFRYKNSDEKAAYRQMRTYGTQGTILYFCETLKDGSKTEYQAQVSVKRTGGGVNGVVDWQLNMIVQSDLTFTDPV